MLLSYLCTPFLYFIMTTQKLTLDIWSDMMCPFCFIGKQNLDTALAQFEHKDQINIQWHSYQLAPDFKTVTGKNAHEVLADYKGIPVAEARQLNGYVADLAQRAGLTFNMDRMQWANSFQAHRLLQYAKTHGLAPDLEQRLFEAVFTNGEDIEDLKTLTAIAQEVGFASEGIENVLTGDAFDPAVQQDIQTGIAYGLRGVPFFVVNQRVSFSGALGVADFLKVLTQVHSEWQTQTQSTTIAQGNSCSIDGECN